MIKAPTSETDTAEIAAHNLHVPSQIWSMISAYLTQPSDFNHFIRSNRAFLTSGTQPQATTMQETIAPVSHSICTALYQRLRAIDITLPEQFVTKNPISEYEAALVKVHHEQEQEIADLCKMNTTLVKKYYDASKLIKLSTLSRLEATHVILDRINRELITNAGTFGENELNLSNIGLTRFPCSLLSDPQHQAYFRRLTELHCTDNFIRVLRLNDLPALQVFDIENNRLHYLDMRNLPELAHVRLVENNLTGTFDLSGFPLLETVGMGSNKLTQLNVTGLKHLHSLDCSYNKLRELTVDSPVISDLNCMSNELLALNVLHVTHLTSHMDDHDPTIQGLSVYDNPHKIVFSMNLIAKFGPELKHQLKCQNDEDSTHEMSADDMEPTSPSI